MDLKPTAKAFAQLDAICDEYADAIRNGDVPFEDGLDSLDPWLQRVSPELRSWLRDELSALRDEHRDGTTESAGPGDIEPACWHAVMGCETFRPLSYEVRETLARQIGYRRFDAGEHLLRSGQPAEGLYLIAEGVVRVVGGDAQQQYEIDTDGAGAVLGEMSMITGYPCAADVIALTSTDAFVMPPDAFATICRQHAEFEIALSQLVSDRLGQRHRDALCGKSLGGYRVQHRLGIGAMGVVYAAESESDGDVRAVKMLRHRFIHSPQVVSRFEQEAELLRRLQHPNVVAFHEHFVAYRTRFIVLDLFDGADLRTVIRQHGPMGETLARGILGQIAAGLRYAHQQGVLHLDLKPANILVDRRGRVAITDFGLSRLIVSESGDRECVGTPPYMPPEQFLMSDVGPHCDWYALGCVAYELTSGKRLFPTDDSARLLDGKLRQPSTQWPEIEGSDEFRAQVRQALEPAVDRRKLDLDEMTSWARPVPELADALADDSFDKGDVS